MQTVIFRTLAPYICALMILFSIFVCLRGHNEPGGGFIGGLIATSAFAVYAMSKGLEAARNALTVHPVTIAGFGMFFAAMTGLPALLVDQPFFTGQWIFIDVFGTPLALSTPLFFDIGVYLVVFGAMTAIVFALEADSL